MTQRLSVFLGVLLGLAVSVAGNLIAAAVQQRAFPAGFSDAALLWLVGGAVVGGLAGYWLSARTARPTDSKGAPEDYPPSGATVSGLKSQFSSTEVTGQGAHVRNSCLFGSRLKIDTGTPAPPQSSPPGAPDREARLNTLYGHLSLVEERKSQYVLETDIPLQLLREERRIRAEIEALERQP